MELKPETGMSRGRALLLLVAAAVLWSTGGLFIKSVDWDPFAIAGTRSAIAALVVLAYLRRPKIRWSIPQFLGGAAYAATVILFVLANKMTTAANAIVLQYACPVYVALLGAVFLGERVSARAWITVAVTLGGMVLFFFDRLSPGGFTGNVLAVISGITLAVLVVCLRMQKEGSPTESILLGNLFAVLVCLPFMFRSAPYPRGMAALVFLGVLQLGLSYLIYSRAIRHVPALEAILVPIIEPVLNPVWVFLFVGEAPGPWAIAGGTIVIATVATYSLLEARRGRERQLIINNEQ
jgi:drug/metabolite transporter (DMT)-like permease